MGIVPLIRAEPGQDEEQDGDDEVGKDHVYPHIQGERGHEGEKFRILFFRFSIKNTDPKCHEWVGEVNSLLSFICDG